MEWLIGIINGLLPALGVTGGLGGVVAAALPLLKRWLANLDTKNAVATNDAESKSLTDIFALGQSVVDYIKARGTLGASDKGAGDGVNFLKGLISDRLKAHGIDDDQVKRIVEAMIARHAAHSAPPAPPAP